METVSDVRKRKLAQLCQEKGGVRAVAAAAGLNYQSLDLVLKSVQGTGMKRAKSLGDDSARAIEKAYSLGAGWLDWPLGRVDHRRYWALSEADRAYAEAKMMAAIEEMESRAKLKKS